MNPNYYRRANEYMDLFEQALQYPRSMLSSAAKDQVLAQAYADYHAHIADEFLNPHTFPTVWYFYTKSIKSMLSPTTWLTWSGILERNNDDDDKDDGNDALVVLKQTLNECVNRSGIQREDVAKKNNEIVFKEQTLVQLFHQRGHEKTVRLLVSRGATMPH